MINFDNHNITGMSYNGHMIRKAYGCDGNLVWSRTPEPYVNKYFTFVSKGDGDFGIYRHVEAGSYDYSKDNGVTWSTISLRPSPSHRISVTNGDRVLLRAKFSDLYQWGDYGCAYITSSVPYDVEGNIMSLIFKDDFIGQISLGGRTATFRRFFDNETNLISAENLALPATTLCKSCYEYMFDGCTSLTTAPSILPAITLNEWCYHNMFANCPSLATAPELPATTLTNWCYTDMFNGCTSLNNITCFATDISANNCTFHWLENTSETGIFNRGENGSCDWTRDENGVPDGWTITPSCETFTGKWLATYSDSHTESAECNSTSAITQNEINITSLVSVEIGQCVTSIRDTAFNSCASLSSVTIGNSVTNIEDFVFYKCYSLTSVTIPNSVISIGMGAFSDCTSLTSVTIGNSVTNIGNSAFAHCSGLTSVTCLATTPPTLDTYVFKSTNDCPIYVPASSVDAYKTANYWNEYASRIQPIS